MRFIDVFEMELQDCINDCQDHIKSSSQMCNHAISLQKERLKKYGYFMRYDIKKHQGLDLYESINYGDAKYDETNYQDHVYLTKAFFKNGKPVYNYREDKKIYIYVEDLKAEKVDGTEVINCPNCGSPSTIDAIRNGCKYCGTHFEMTDIYPTVSNYFFMDNFSMVDQRDNLRTPVGAVKTYANAYAKLGKLIQMIPSTVSMVADGALTSMSRFESTMKQYIPDFSYMHFGDQTIAMLKLILFSDDPSSLPFFKRDNCPVIAPNLLDFEYKGFGIENKEIVVNGNYVTAGVYIYMKSIYDSPTGLVRVDEKYKAILSRDISKPVKFGFSYTKINCSSCGGVFDAIKIKKCPYCSTPYTLQDEEWFVIDIAKA